MHGPRRRSVLTSRSGTGDVRGGETGVPAQVCGTCWGSCEETRGRRRPAAGQRLKLFLRQVRLRHAEEIRPEWTTIHNLSRKCSFRSCSKLPDYFLAAPKAQIWHHPKFLDYAKGEHEQNGCCLIPSTELVCPFFFFSSSVEVNNFLKIDENQNEEVESELPDSPVSV